LETFSEKMSASAGTDNAVYSTANTDPVGAIDTSIYDYPTRSSSITKSTAQSKTWSASPLEYYSTMEYTEVVDISQDMTSVSFAKASVASRDYEVPYYTPANLEDELYSQLRDEKIKAIQRKDIEIDERLGSGEFGDVVKGYWKSVDYSVEVALKTLSGGQGQEGRRKLLQEAAIMSQFRHPNVVKLYGVVNDDNDKLMLVLELLGKGDLRQLLHTMRPDPGQLVSPQTPMKLLNHSQQIAVGLQYLSSKNFVHRDLAARNILISNDNTCKISDFGMARNLIEDDYYVSQGGKIPLKWTAPEALVYHKYSTASDMWSYGCVLYEIWTLGHKPFESMSNQEVLLEVEAGYRLPPPPGCPQVIYGLMIRCWHPDPSSRPTAADIVLALMENEETVLRVPEEDAATSRLWSPGSSSGGRTGHVPSPAGDLPLI
jgi:serine/threonine protein kinase